MKRLYKSILIAILACLVIAGSIIGTSAACSERVVYYYGNNGSSCGNLNGSGENDSCPNSYSNLHDFLSKYCSGNQCKNLYDMLNNFGCGNNNSTDSNCSDNSCADNNRDENCDTANCPTQVTPTHTPTEAPAPADKPTQAPAQKPTQAPAEKPTQKPAQTPTEKPAEKPTQTKGYELKAYELEVVRLINEIRAQNGLGQLSVNTELSRVARIKSQDMHDKRYFSHTSPTYGSPFDMMTAFGIRYRTAGENIAMGYRTPQSVVDGWMNSPGHRANILNANFTQIGMGYVESGSYWTQMFIS